MSPRKEDKGRIESSKSSMGSEMLTSCLSRRVEGGKLSDQWWKCMHHQMANVSCPEMAAYVP